MRALRAASVAYQAEPEALLDRGWMRAGSGSAYRLAHPSVSRALLVVVLAAAFLLI
jgi:hypothetical protein